MERKTNPTRLEKQARERITALINEYCNGSQQQLSEKTGVNKASISQYVNGKNVPSSLTAKRLCLPFRISPAWLMGFDVPKYDTKPLEPVSAPLTSCEQRLIELNRQLNDEGQEKLTDYASDLVASGRYIKDHPDGMVEEA